MINQCCCLSSNERTERLASQSNRFVCFFDWHASPTQDSIDFLTELTVHLRYESVATRGIATQEVSRDMTSNETLTSGRDRTMMYRLACKQTQPVYPSPKT